MDPGLARRLADDYVAKLERLGEGSARVVDKMPDNVLHLGVAALLFPGARVVFCRRDLRDICLSCYFRHFSEPMPYAQDLADCGRRALEIERLADHWRRVLPLRMHTIDYEALVADLEGESRRLIAFLGLDWEPACLEFHKTERPVLTASSLAGAPAALFPFGRPLAPLRTPSRPAAAGPGDGRRGDDRPFRVVTVVRLDLENPSS